MYNQGVVSWNNKVSILLVLQVKTAFLQYDINRDGKISKQELEDGMVQSGQFSFDDARTAFDIADINGDGEIDIGEFVTLMFPNAAEIVSQVLYNFPNLLYIILNTNKIEFY